MPNLVKQYKKEIAPQLKKELEIDNEMAVPKVEKIVVNSGIGKILQENPKALEDMIEDFKKIVGQKPIKTRAKQSVASFKIREGQVVGLSATLRGKRMYDFLDKLINVTFPRIRDFRGFSKKGFDGYGNYTVGLKEHTVFPEMAEDDPRYDFGLETTIVTTTDDDNAGYKLLKKFNFPFND